VVAVVNAPGAVFGEMSGLLAKPHSATVRATSGATVHAFYFERGPNILVLRYAIGAEGERPQDVTATLLDQVVRSIGLV